MRSKGELDVGWCSQTACVVTAVYTFTAFKACTCTAPFSLDFGLCG